MSKNSDCGLSAEEVKGHGREEGWDTLLVMQMEGHHLFKSFGELRFHKLHGSIGALHQMPKSKTSNNYTSASQQLLKRNKIT